MIAPAVIPAAYEAWNERWHAPHGRGLPTWTGRLPARVRHAPVSERLLTRRRGPFAFQPNSSTRRFEYPWAFAQLPVGRDSTVAELGGALSGLQFAIAESGARVLNVDPFIDYGTAGEYGDVDPHAGLAALNAAFGTDVELRRSTFPDAGIPAGSLDAVSCISTLEHLPSEAAEETVRHVERALRPHGRLVLTVDLFLDIAPFTTRPANRWGTNLDVRALVERSGLRLVGGVTSELCGYPEFDTDRVLSDLGRYLIGDYPGLAQCLVLEKAG